MESAEAFWRQQNGVIDWPTFSALKAEVDRLTLSDLGAARTLARRLTELARLTGNPLSQAFADASRARILHQEGQHVESKTPSRPVPEQRYYFKGE